jgi:RND family efflux transporter MFP subunit
MKITRRIIYWVAYMQKSDESAVLGKKVPVEIEFVSTNSIEETIEMTGWIKANKVVDVTSKVPGRIESLRTVLGNGDLVPVEEGLAVKKGQRIAVIDHDVYLAQVAAARANMKAREVELADAEREKERIIALYEGGSATEQSRDKAVTAAELAAARSSLAKADLELAEINLRESTINSPIDGIVTAKHIDQGNLIRAGDRIVTVADMKTVKIIVAAAEKYAPEITVGTPVKIKVDAFADRVFDAKVYSVYPTLDEETHTIQVEIRLKNEQLSLKPGMFARVILITKSKDDVIVIPRDVVLGGKIDKPYVYVVEEKIAHKRFVEIGITQDERYEITDGLKEGEMLVVNGMNYLTDGINVELVRIEDIK